MNSYVVVVVASAEASSNKHHSTRSQKIFHGHFIVCMPIRVLTLQGQAGNTGPWSGQVFRKWIPHLKAALSCGTIRTECLAEGLLTDPQKKELMGVEDDSAKHNDRLLDMLSRGTAETFHTFCSIVRSTEPEANFSKFLDDMQSVDTFVAGKYKPYQSGDSETLTELYDMSSKDC